MRVIKKIKDKKTAAIILLAIAILILIGALCFQSLKYTIINDRQQVFLQGIAQGRLLEQKDILSGIFASGYYIIPFFDQNNQTQNVALGIIQGQTSEDNLE